MRAITPGDLIEVLGGPWRDVFRSLTIRGSFISGAWHDNVSSIKRESLSTGIVVGSLPHGERTNMVYVLTPTAINWIREESRPDRILECVIPDPEVR